jgi:hypothetical protein
MVKNQSEWNPDFATLARRFIYSQSTIKWFKGAE